MWGVVLCLRDWRKYWLPVAFLAAYALPVLLLYNFGRFRIGLMPVWIVLAAHGLDWILPRGELPMRGAARGQWGRWPWSA